MMASFKSAEQRAAEIEQVLQAARSSSLREIQRKAVSKVTRSIGARPGPVNAGQAAAFRIKLSDLLRKRAGAPPKPFARGPGQGITGRGFQYEFPEQPSGRGPIPVLPTAPPSGRPKIPAPPSGPKIPTPPSFAPHDAAPRFSNTTGGGEAGSGAAQTKACGIVILEGTQQHPPHTLMDKRGRHVHTDRWFDSVFLCYDSALPVEARGGRDDPMMGLHGRQFSVYYPASTRADWRSILTSGSSGRWLQSWSLKSSYVRM